MLHGDFDRRDRAVGPDLQPLLYDRALLRRHLADGGRQVAAQPFADHRKQIMSRRARGGLQEESREPMNVHNVSPVIDEDARRGKVVH